MLKASKNIEVLQRLARTFMGTRDVSPQSIVHATLEPFVNRCYSLPDIDLSSKITISKNEGKLEFEIPDVPLPFYEIDKSDASKLPHEMVCSLLTGNRESDVKLMSYFGQLNDGCDRMSPDIIIKLDEFYLVIEIGTTRSAVIETAKSDFKMKTQKYFSALETRAKSERKPIFLMPIIVSYDTVVSSFELPKDMVEMFCSAYRWGDMIYRSAEPFLLVDETRTRGARVEIRDNLKEQLKSMNFESTEDAKDYDFNEETFDYYCNYETSQEKNKDFYKKILLHKINEENTKEKCTDKMEKAFIDLETKMTEFETRNDDKRPINFPFFLPKRRKNGKVSFDRITNPRIDNQEIPILSLWSELIDESIEHKEYFEEDVSKLLEEALLDDDNLIEKVEEVQKANRRKWHRVQVSSLSDNTKRYLALDGLNSKKLKNEAYIKNRRTMQQRSFDPKTNVSGMESDLKYVPKKFPTPTHVPGMISSTALIREAVKLSGSTNKGIKLVEDLISTDVFCSLMTIALISQELLISLKQNVKSDEFIYKRVRGLECEIIIHPIRKDSHIFYSLRFKTEHELLFPNFGCKVYKKGDWFYTDLKSTNRSKLVNQIKAPFIWSNLMIHWLIRGEPSDKKTISFIKEELAEKITVSGDHQLLSLLGTMIALEDKASTEELVTGIRYIAMQFFKGNNAYSPPDPSKAITKLPVVLRSKLGVLIYNRIKSYCRMQMKNLPVLNLQRLKTLPTEINGDNWANLINPLTLNECSQARIIVDTFYLGYTHNKDEEPNQNSDFQMIKKIIDYVYNEDPEKLKNGMYTGKSKPDPNNVGPHEWDIDAVCEAVSLAEIRLKAKYGSDFKDVIADNVLDEILKRGHCEALATMKASALFQNISKVHSFTLEEEYLKNERTLNFKVDAENPELLDLVGKINSTKRKEAKNQIKARLMTTDELKLESNVKEMKEGKKTYYNSGVAFDQIDDEKVSRKQCKCIEAIVAELKEDKCFSSVHPLFCLDKITKSLVKEWGGICCYLFKKNQHGGLREIYVLTLKSRLVQLFVETAFRCLCSEFVEETMTHPENKVALLDQHNKDALNLGIARGCKIMSWQSSEDKTKWNQNNNVNMYAFIACKIFPKWLAEPIFSCLSLWRGKKIFLPEGVQNMLRSNYVARGDQEAFNNLYHEYWNKPEKLLEEKGGNFLKSNTGMWQGILHYTSSFQHILQTIHYKKILKETYFEFMKNLGAEEVLITTLVSSDDSYTKISVLFPGNLDDDHITTIASLCTRALYAEEVHSEFFCMKESVKSCLAAPYVGEFNSTFFIADGLVNPLIKSVIASLSLVNSENFMDRFHQYYNLIKDVYENGGGHYQSHLHQIVQAFFHYSSLGMSVNPIATSWVSDILLAPCPQLGFFLLDNEYTAGLMGYDFSYYMSLVSKDCPVLVSSTSLKKLKIIAKEDKIVDEESTTSGAKLEMSREAYEKNFPSLTSTEDVKEMSSTKDIISQEKLEKKDNYIGISSNITLRSGNRNRWKACARRVQIDNWEERIEENPGILYKHKAETTEEALLRLSAKMNSKGIFESLNSDSTIIPMFSASVYLMSSHALTIHHWDLTREEEETYKRSLLCLTRKFSELTSQGLEREISSLGKVMMFSTLSNSFKSVLFPNYQLYDRIIKAISKLRENWVEKTCLPFRMRKNKIILQTSDQIYRVPLIEAVRKIWYSYDSKVSRSSCLESLNRHKDIFPWLSDSEMESFKSSPFNTHKEMHDFIGSLIPRIPTVNPLCRPMRTNIPSQQIIESMRFNNFPGVVFDLPKNVKFEVAEEMVSSVDQLKRFRNIINYILLFPEKDSVKEELIKEIVKNSKVDLSKYNKNEIPQGLYPTLLLFNLCSRNVQTSELILDLTRIEGGLSMIYLKEQKKEKKRDGSYTWTGYGQIGFIGSKNDTLVHVMDDHVIAIETRHPELLRADLKTIVFELGKLNINIHKPYITKSWLSHETLKLCQLNVRDFQGLMNSTGAMSLRWETGYVYNRSSVPIYQGEKIELQQVYEFSSKFCPAFKVKQGRIQIFMQRRIERCIIPPPTLEVLNVRSIKCSGKLYIDEDCLNLFPISKKAEEICGNSLILDWIYNRKPLMEKIGFHLHKLYNKHESSKMDSEDKDLRTFLNEAIKLRACARNLLTSISADLIVPFQNVNIIEDEMQRKKNLDDLLNSITGITVEELFGALKFRDLAASETLELKAPEKEWHEAPSLSGSEQSEDTDDSIDPYFTMDDDFDDDSTVINTVKESERPENPVLLADSIADTENTVQEKTDNTSMDSDKDTIERLENQISKLKIEVEKLQESIVSSVLDWDEEQTIQDEIDKKMEDIADLRRSLSHEVSLKGKKDLTGSVKAWRSAVEEHTNLQAISETPIIGMLLKLERERIARMNNACDTEESDKVVFPSDVRPMPTYLNNYHLPVEISDGSTKSSMSDHIFTAHTYTADNLAYKNMRQGVFFQHQCMDDFIDYLTTLNVWHILEGNSLIPVEMIGLFTKLCWLLDIQLPNTQTTIEDQLRKWEQSEQDVNIRK